MNTSPFISFDQHIQHNTKKSLLSPQRTSPHLHPPPPPPTAAENPIQTSITSLLDNNNGSPSKIFKKKTTRRKELCIFTHPLSDQWPHLLMTNKALRNLAPPYLTDLHRLQPTASIQLMLTSCAPANDTMHTSWREVTPFTYLRVLHARLVQNITQDSPVHLSVTNNAFLPMPYLLFFIYLLFFVPYIECLWVSWSALY